MGYYVGAPWTKEKIREAILHMVEETGTTHMPTRSEIRNFYGDERLTNKICKTLGYYGWANELGLQIPNNDTRKGKIGEEYATMLLTEKGYSVERMPQNHPYDLLIADSAKVDVKYSALYRGEHGNFYSFRIQKRNPTCDAYMLLAKKDHSYRVFIVPSMCVSVTQISIGEHRSMYDKYENAFGVIDCITEAFQRLKAI